MPSQWSLEVKQATWIWMEFQDEDGNKEGEGCLHADDVQNHLCSIFQTFLNPKDDKNVEVNVNGNEYTIKYNYIHPWAGPDWDRAFRSLYDAIEGSPDSRIRHISGYEYERLLKDDFRFSHVIIVKKNQQ